VIDLPSGQNKGGPSPSSRRRLNLASVKADTTAGRRGLSNLFDEKEANQNELKVT